MRDKVEDRQVVWRMICMWTEAVPTIMKVHDQERFKAYETQVFKGLLDADLRPHSVCMDKDYTPEMLRFAREQRDDQVCYCVDTCLKASEIQ